MDDSLVTYSLAFLVILLAVGGAYVRINYWDKGKDIDLGALFSRKKSDATLQAPSEAAPRARPPGPLWDPAQILPLSIVGSVAFGAVLIAMNWRTLNHKIRATTAMVWAVSCVLLIPVWIGSEGLFYFMFFLPAWWFMSYRPHRNYLFTTYGKSFPKRNHETAQRYVWYAALGFAGIGYLLFIYLS